MKTIKHLLSSLAVSLFVISMATAADIAPVLRVEGSNLYLSLEQVAAPTSVRILDAAGFIRLEEKVAAAGQFKKVFDLASLPAGNYQLVIQSSEEEIVQPITITEQGLLLNEDERKAYFRASVAQQRDQLQLALQNPTQSTVSVFVIDAQGRVAYQDVIKGQPVIDKHYDLKRLPAGRYTVIVEHDHERLTKGIKVW